MLNLQHTGCNAEFVNFLGKDSCWSFLYIVHEMSSFIKPTCLP